MRLVVLDSVLIDLTLRVGALPDRGGDVRCDGSSLSVGGGFNVLAAARRQGVDALYAGRLGDGPFADLARAALAAEGVAVLDRSEGGPDLGVCVVVVDGGGERTFMTAPGAELALDPSSLATLELVADDYLYLSGYNLAHPELARVISPWFESVPEYVTVAFDLGARFADADPGVLAKVLARTDWLLASANEGRALTELGDLEAVARDLRGRVRHGVVIHDGASGCVVASGGVVNRVTGYPARVADSNGAGDAHNGVFLAGLANGLTAVGAADRANGAAAMAIEAHGPATAPTAANLDAWFESVRA